MFFARCLAMSSTAGMIAECFTVCLDAAKVRLQLQEKMPKGAGTPKYTGVIQCVSRMYAEEGARALFYGLGPGVQRQFLFVGLGNGLYPPIRDAICGDLKPGEYATGPQKILAGLVTGAIAITVACPTDVAKVRLQSQGQLPKS